MSTLQETQDLWILIDDTTDLETNVEHLHFFFLLEKKDCYVGNRLYNLKYTENIDKIIDVNDDSFPGLVEENADSPYFLQNMEAFELFFEDNLISQNLIDKDSLNLYENRKNMLHIFLTLGVD